MYLTLWGEVKKRQTEVQASDTDLMNAAGWTRKVWRDRNSHPEKITLAEFTAICSYLGLKIERRER